MFGRARELWTYDLPRQSLIAFALPALVVTLIVAAGAALDWGSSDEPYYPGDPNPQASEGQLRQLTTEYARSEAGVHGFAAANDDLSELLASGAYEDGRGLAYDRSWNMAIAAALPGVPSQRLANEPGTQWIELVR